MLRIVIIVLVAALVVLMLAETRSGSIRYCVQLVRGTDSDQPPEVGDRHAETNLAGTLRGVLKWKNYWQICRRNVAVVPGRKTRVQLSNGREVEIDLTLQGKRTVEAFRDGQLVNRITQPLGQAMTLVGGPRDPDSAWFIMVRRDGFGE